MVKYRKVRFYVMKFGITNKEVIISQAYSRHLKVYVKIDIQERGKQ